MNQVVGINLNFSQMNSNNKNKNRFRNYFRNYLEFSIKPIIQ